ncbi:MAG: spore coat protein CotJB [Halothermotrichaceae bacterium]
MDRKHRRINVDLLKDIMSLKFAVLETILYLDTHPEDETVLKLHNQFATHLEELIREYQQNYGLLSPYCPNAKYPWQWIDEPWPWQIEY